MRDIKFRGKRIDGQSWICGWLRKSGHQDIEKLNGQYIRTEKYYQIQDDKYNSQFVAEGTIGQYTGLKDKNGKEIYEGDIVRLGTYTKGVVEYSDEYAQFIIINTNTIEYEYEPLADYTKIEIIGNKWDNPELLKNT